MAPVLLKIGSLPYSWKQTAIQQECNGYSSTPFSTHVAGDLLPHGVPLGTVVTQIIL